VDGGSDGPALRALGATCTAGAQCASTYCVDGVCCDGSCTGSCQQCNLGTLKGTCSNVPQGMTAPSPHTACQMSATTSCGLDGTCDGQGHCEDWPSTTSCAGGTCDPVQNQSTSGSFCDGKGACKASTAVTCAPYKCASGNLKCATTCASDNDCVGQPCVNGSCGKVANGSLCTSGGQCTSGNCVDGYCCDTTCTGSCEACDVSPTQGTCTKVPSGAPHGTTRTACAGTGVCKGTCNGTSTACVYPTITCASQTCSMGTLMLASSCNGAGSCNAQQSSSCNGLACNTSNACYGTCTSDAQCTSGLYCHTDTGACQSTAPLGHTCGGSVSCQAGLFCTNGYCCGTSTCPQCQACGSSGSCAASSTTNGATCSDGNLCTTNDSCQGGSCVGGAAVTCTAIDKCHVAGTCTPASGVCTNPVAPGASCSSGQACLAWYVDCDGDSYGAPGTTPVYSCNQPPRAGMGTCPVSPSVSPSYVSNNTDCCDHDSLTFPGQTMPQGYQNGCGNYDYNCDTHETPTYALQSCGAVPPGNGAGCSIYTSGPNLGLCYVSGGCAGCSIVNGECISILPDTDTTGACGSTLHYEPQTCYNTGPITCDVMTDTTMTVMQTCL
jgi:hypothetical protein